MKFIANADVEMAVTLHNIDLLDFRPFYGL